MGTRSAFPGLRSSLLGLRSRNLLFNTTTPPLCHSGPFNLAVPPWSLFILRKVSFVVYPGELILYSFPSAAPPIGVFVFCMPYILSANETCSTRRGQRTKNHGRERVCLMSRSKCAWLVTVYVWRSISTMGLPPLETQDMCLCRSFVVIRSLSFPSRALGPPLRTPSFP